MHVSVSQTKIHERIHLTLLSKKKKKVQPAESLSSTNDLISMSLCSGEEREKGDWKGVKLAWTKIRFTTGIILFHRLFMSVSKGSLSNGLFPSPFTHTHDN